MSSRVRVRDGPNAVVFDDGGGLTRTASFGDGIEHVLVDQRNRAWVGYFDEGVFGNLGWSGPDGPTRGLVRFDLASGEADLSFVPRDGLRPIDDCYALNIAEDAVWACYYSKFDLVRIGSDGAMRRWTTGSSGARALVTDGARTLLVGQYGDPWKATLWTNGTDALGNPRHVRLELSDGTTPTSRFFGRGDRIVVSDGPRWYAASLSDLTAFDGSEQDSVAEQSTPADHIPHRHF